MLTLRILLAFAGLALPIGCGWVRQIARWMEG